MIIEVDPIFNRVKNFITLYFPVKGTEERVAEFWHKIGKLIFDELIDAFKSRVEYIIDRIREAMIEYLSANFVHFVLTKKKKKKKDDGIAKDGRVRYKRGDIWKDQGKERLHTFYMPSVHDMFERLMQCRQRHNKCENNRGTLSQELYSPYVVSDDDKLVRNLVDYISSRKNR